MNEKEFYIYLGNKLSDRIRVKFLKEKGMIIDMLIQYEALVKEKWHAIVRYDCTHGFFRRDTLKPNGEKEKKNDRNARLKYSFCFCKTGY